MNAIHDIAPNENYQETLASLAVIVKIKIDRDVEKNDHHIAFVDDDGVKSTLRAAPNKSRVSFEGSEEP